ncbi:MAG: acetylornithine/succinylornithine family transaminase [Ruminococcaceae bacterium]|nr:acetylornithine/succinylornithine family transaminase [Oscillospiraceae bacterium]
MKTIEKENLYVAGTYKRFPIEIVSGKGATAVDSNGKEYIDLASGIAVNTFGYSDDEWIAAVTKQLTTLQHTSNLYYTDPCVELAALLCEKTGMKKVFFSNSGAEANECAIKAARKYAENKGNSTTILTLLNSFHGRTLTTLAATGQETFHKDFLPLTEGFAYTPANDIAALTEAFEKYSPCAVMFEVVQGEGGVNPLEYDFVKKIEELCTANDALMICDEVQIGNGRSGKLYGYMHYGISPDVVTTAKGLGGGLPIGATMLGERVKDIFTYGSHGSTFGGNPVCCAGAVNIITRLDEAMLSEVIKKSELIKNTLEGSEGVESVTGLGLMLGIKTAKPAGEVVSRCIENGVLVITAKDKVRLLPPLNIPMEELKKALAVIKDACR